MSGDTKRVLEVNQIDNLQGSTQRVKQETTLNNLRGVTQRVYVVGGGGSTPVIDELNVTPSTSAQTITAPEGVDGYSPVNVSAVDNTIDANIVAGNIKKDVQILGVTGSYEGQTPTGTMYIISNGTYNVADKAIANVQVPTTAPAYYVDFTKDSSNMLSKSSNIINLSGVTDISNYTFYYTYLYKAFPANTTIDLSSLTALSGLYCCGYMFSNCTGITSADLSGLTQIGGSSACNNMFKESSLISCDLSSLIRISGSYACSNMFNKSTGLTSVDLSSLTTIDGGNACAYMFYNCTGLTSVDLSSLTTIDGGNACQGMFQGCTGLMNVVLNSLANVSSDAACQQMFKGCNLQSAYLPALVNMSNLNRRFLTLSEMFGDCQIMDLRNLRYAGNYTLDSLCYLNTTLTTVNLNSLEYIGNESARTLFYVANPSSTLTDVYFPMLTIFGTNPFYTNAFYNRTNLTIHFRKDAQATIEALPNYASLWGAGTGSSAVFDLAGTLTGADSNSYARSEKDSVYASETGGAAKTATAWSYNNTIYYTSGGNEPQVGDTIYSDSACTTAVTTISSIA